MSVMTKPRKHPAEQSQPPKRSGEQLGVYLPAPLMRALEAFIAQARPRTNKTAVTEQALEEFLERQGHWPAAPAPPKPSDLDESP